MLINQFKNKQHEQAFIELIEQGELEVSNDKEQDELIRRQIAFLYLIGIYQEDYECYEGMKFYVEVYEEISIDGPVYLLEERVKLEDFAHEKMLKVAKAILKGEMPQLDELEVEDKKFAQVAMRFALG